MMSEVTLQWISILKILLVGVFAGLYGFGGVRGKWKRRIIAPIVYTLGIVGFSLWTGSFHWSYLLCAVLLYGALTLPYGASIVVEKIKKRSLYGLACVTASLPVFIVNRAWTLLGLHILICVSTSVIAGVWNETSSARAEETMIGASIIFVPLYVI